MGRASVSARPHHPLGFVRCDAGDLCRAHPRRPRSRVTRSNMPGIDEKRPFVPLKIAVLTVSDTRELADDKSGATLAERIEKAGHAVAARAIVTDDVEKIRAQMREWINEPGIDVIISTGGTGFTGRD